MSLCRCFRVQSDRRGRPLIPGVYPSMPTLPCRAAAGWTGLAARNQMGRLRMIAATTVIAVRLWARTGTDYSAEDHAEIIDLSFWQSHRTVAERQRKPRRK